jgi:hypothetical protein
MPNLTLRCGCCGRQEEEALFTHVSVEHDLGEGGGRHGMQGGGWIGSGRERRLGESEEKKRPRVGAASLESRPSTSARLPPPSLPASSLFQSRPSTFSISSQLFNNSSPNSTTPIFPSTTNSTGSSPRSRIASLESTLRAQLFACVASKPVPSPSTTSDPTVSSSFPSPLRPSPQLEPFNPHSPIHSPIPSYSSVPS